VGFVSTNQGQDACDTTNQTGGSSASSSPLPPPASSVAVPGSVDFCDVVPGDVDQKNHGPLAVKSNRMKMEERNDGCVFWEVELKKSEHEYYGFSQCSGKEWNLDTDDGPEHWIVNYIGPGVLYRWNQEHPHEQVRIGDRVVAVNGVNNLHDMQETQRESQIKVKMCRFPEVFELQLRKNGQKLGFESEDDDYSEIRIAKVHHDGAIAESNRKEIKEFRWHRVVLPEMFIIAVNDVKGSAERLGEELRASETLRLQIRRPNCQDIPGQLGFGQTKDSSQVDSNRDAHNNQKRPNKLFGFLNKMKKNKVVKTSPEDRNACW
jgi:hypothetical protein